MKKHSLKIAVRLIILAMLLFGLYFFFQGTTLFMRRETPPERPSLTQPLAPAAAPEIKTEPAAAPQRATGRMELDTAARQPVAGEAEANSGKWSFSRKKENKERQLTPGVVVVDKGVTVKIPDQEETVQIKRENTYRPGEYQVLWQKKY